MSGLWSRGRGHHAKKRPREYQLPPEERAQRHAGQHEDPEPTWDRFGDNYRD